MNKVIKTNLAPEPVGAYSQAILSGDLLFSSQIGISPATGKLVENCIESQTKQTLDNLKNILQEAGMTLGNVVKTTVFLTDMSNFTKVNQVYSTYFKENPPARTTVEVNKVPLEGLVGIEVIAHR